MTLTKYSITHSYNDYLLDSLNTLDSALQDTPDWSDWIQDSFARLLTFTDDFDDKQNGKFLLRLENRLDDESNSFDNDRASIALEKHYPQLNE